MSAKISVIICTHNPREDYLRRTLEALERQSLPSDQWELLLIDNASKAPLVAADKREKSREGKIECTANQKFPVDLNWHSNARIVREEKVGLTQARLRGIKEAISELLLFVDDDNVLCPDYLERGLLIFRTRPDLGAWGGQQIPVFEEGVEVDTWKRAFWTATLDRDIWSNNYDMGATPIGAGVFIRKPVAEEYAGRVGRDERRRQLDRAGSGLNSNGDIDMAFTACDMGLGTGRFKDLLLHHLMPTSRLVDGYIEQLCEGFGYSDAVLRAIRGQAPSSKSRIDRLVEAYKSWRLPAHLRMRLRARARGHARAVAEWRQTR